VNSCAPEGLAASAPLVAPVTVYKPGAGWLMFVLSFVLLVYLFYYIFEGFCKEKKMMQSMIKVTEMCIKMLVFIYFTTYPHS
jgi:hypothetical protein